MYSFKHREMPNNLWVVSCVTNPQRYRSRYDLYQEFEKHVLASGANLLVVEGALRQRPHELDGEHVHRVQLHDELWHKENLLNVGISRLPNDWQYVAWVDADVQFTRRDWVAETIHQLQHYQIVQMFSHAIDLGPHGEHIGNTEGFVYSWMRGSPRPSQKAARCYRGGTFHPGYAWAMRRETFNALGGLLDIGALGSGDHHMAHALIGDVAEGWRGQGRSFCSKAYADHLYRWQRKATIHVRQNIGYMPGTLVHSWHGSKASRRYGDRWQILNKHAFNPDTDLCRDWQGVLQFTHEGARMRNDFRNYFRARNEDSVDQ